MKVLFAQMDEGPFSKPFDGHFSATPIIVFGCIFAVAALIVFLASRSAKPKRRY